jgi:Zn-dependent protease
VSTEFPEEQGGHPARRRGGLIGRIFAPLLVIGGVLLKVAGSLKFLGIFVAVGGYALIWGWPFGLGFVLLILVHELGHYVEAKRQGLNPQIPVFIPFLGAYVRHTRGNPWQTTRVAIAGPILGGAGAFACYLAAESSSSDLLMALAYFGFVLNLFNLLPFGIFDGGAVWRSTRWLWYGGGREKAIVSAALFIGTAVFLALGAYQAYLPQHRL